MTPATSEDEARSSALELSARRHEAADAGPGAVDLCAGATDHLLPDEARLGLRNGVSLALFAAFALHATLAAVVWSSLRRETPQVEQEIPIEVVMEEKKPSESEAAAAERRKAAEQKAAQDKTAQDKAAQEARAAQEAKAAQDEAAREEAERQRKTAEAKAEQDKAEQDKAAQKTAERQKAAQDARAAQEKAAQEQAAQEAKAAQEKAAQEAKAAQEQAAREQAAQKAAEARAARQAAADEKAARARAAQEAKVAEKKAAEERRQAEREERKAAQQARAEERRAEAQRAQTGQSTGRMQTAGLSNGLKLPFDNGPPLFKAVAVPVPTDGGEELLNYKVVVFGMLERAKQYPEGARERGARGRAVIAFSLNEKGELVNVSLLRSTGDSDLDVEALGLAARASPFPKPPPGAQRDFAAEISFDYHDARRHDAQTDAAPVPEPEPE